MGLMLEQHLDEGEHMGVSCCCPAVLKSTAEVVAVVVVIGDADAVAEKARCCCD